MSNSNSKKEYIIKFRGSMAYLKNISKNRYTYTFKIEEAKRYTKEEAEKVVELKDFEIINYDEELYKSKEEKYKLYIEVMSEENYDIKKDDLICFLEEYEFTADGSGKFTSYIELKKDYPNSKLIDEIVRMGEIIKYKDIVKWHEARVELSKDIEFNLKNNVNYNITSEDVEQYEKSKRFLETMKEKFPYDYDIEKQYEMLDKAFREKYISKEIYKEYYESHYEEDFEEYEEEFTT